MVAQSNDLDWSKISTYRDLGLLIESPKKKGKYICPNCDDDELSIHKDGIKFDCYSCHDCKKILHILENEAWTKGLKPSAKKVLAFNSKERRETQDKKTDLKTITHPTEVQEFLQKHYPNKLEYNVRSLGIELNGKEESMDTFRQLIAQRYNTSIGKENLIEACLFLSRLRSYDPVERFLVRCKESAKPVSINNLIYRYLGADHPEGLYEMYFRKWAIGCVQRVFEPGCFNKSCLVLQGATDLAKSFFFHILANDGEFFTDNMTGNFDKDDKMLVNANWIVEIDEIGRVTGKNFDNIKQFITKRIEQFRPPYARDLQKFPRRFMLCGTVNETDYLVDPTGNVRFWTIPATKPVDKDKLRKEQMGIWARIMQLYEAGETSELPDKFRSLRDEENLRYTRSNLWLDILEAFLIREFSNKEKPFTSRLECYKELEKVLDQKIDKNQAGNQKQLTATLTNLGLKETKRTQPDGSRPNIWIPTDQWVDKYTTNQEKVDFQVGQKVLLRGDEIGVKGTIEEINEIGIVVKFPTGTRVYDIDEAPLLLVITLT